MDRKLINGLMDVMTDKSMKWEDSSILDLFQKEKEGSINLKLSSYYKDIENDSIKIIKKNTKTGFEIWMYIPFRNDKKPYVLVNTIDKFILINDMDEGSMPHTYRYYGYGIDVWYADCLKKEFETIMVNHQKLDNYRIIIANDFINNEKLKMQGILEKKIKTFIESEKSIHSISNDYYKDYYEKQMKNRKNKIKATIDLFKNNPEVKLVNCSHIGFYKDEIYLKIVYDICLLYDYIINNKAFESMMNRVSSEIIDKDNLYDDGYYKRVYVENLVNRALREKFSKKPWKMMKLDEVLLNCISDVKQFIVESKTSNSIHIIKTTSKYGSFYQTIENSKVRIPKKEIKDIDESYMNYRFPCVLDITKIIDTEGNILYDIKK